MNICFVGVDGSGKTTHAKRLHNWLRSRGVDSVYVHFDFSLRKYIPSRIRKTLYSSSHKERSELVEKESAERKKYTTKMYAMLFLIFSLLDGFIYYLKGPRSRVRIYDRYFYDYLVEFFELYPDCVKMLYISLLPRPDIVFYLDVPPSIAYARSREYPLSYYSLRRRRYLKLLRCMRSTKVIIFNTSRSKTSNSLTILSHVSRCFNKAGHKNETRK